MKVTHHPQPVPKFSMMGIAVTPLVTDADTAGGWEAVLQAVGPGGGSPLHTIAAHKLFVVLSGVITFVIDGEELESGPGASATVPAGVPHRFQNRSDAPAQLLVVTSDGGHIAFLEGLAALSAAGPVDPMTLRAHAREHHVELL